MSAHHEIGTGFAPGARSAGMPAQQVRFLGAARHVDRVMRHHDSQLASRTRSEALRDALDLARRDFAVLVPVRPRRVDAEHHEVVRLVGRFEVGAEDTRIRAVGPEHARHEVEERDVVVAGNGDQRRGRQPLDQPARGIELGAFRALRDIPGEHYQIGAHVGR
jgi:hypothetical protein